MEIRRKSVLRSLGRPLGAVTVEGGLHRLPNIRGVDGVSLTSEFLVLGAVHHPFGDP